MAKLFIGLALVLMLATAAVAFLAKGNIDKLQTSVKTNKQEADLQAGKARTALTEKDAAVKEKDAATAKADEATKALETATTEANSAKLKGQELTAKVDSQTKEIEILNERISKMNPSAPVPTTPTGVDQVVVDALKGDLQKAQAEAAEAKQMVDSLINKGKENEAKLADLQRKENLRSKGVTQPGLQGRILAVNAGWNFVVLNVGDKQGVMVNSSLLVVRSGEPIARLRITSVEPSTSIADVIPGSVRSGLSVQPGDNIIFEGRAEPKIGSGNAAPSSPLPN